MERGSVSGAGPASATRCATHLRELADSVGDPMDESKFCGPMVSSKQQDSVSSYIAAGIEEGATLVAGGLGMPEGLDKGYFVRPTVFANVTPEMTIFREEIFGPVVTAQAFRTSKEAIALANNTKCDKNIIFDFL